jgi:hypothetical protein
MRSPFVLLVLFACSAHESSDGPAKAPASSPTPAKAEPTKAAPKTEAALTGYPWARLVHPDNPVEPLTFAVSEATLAELGVKSHRSFTATQPQIWLLAFEFVDQPALLAAEPKLLAKLGDGPPYARQTAYTGAWLLVTGFPSDKPVSPEMQFARDDFRGRWAGEE